LFPIDKENPWLKEILMTEKRIGSAKSYLTYRKLRNYERKELKESEPLYKLPLFHYSSSKMWLLDRGT